MMRFVSETYRNDGIDVTAEDSRVLIAWSAACLTSISAKPVMSTTGMTVRNSTRKHFLI